MPEIMRGSQPSLFGQPCVLIIKSSTMKSGHRKGFHPSVYNRYTLHNARIVSINVKLVMSYI